MAQPSIKGPITLLIGTRKGAFFLNGNQTRQKWEVSDALFLGHIINHFMVDPRDHRIVLMTSKTGHLGPTLFRSTNAGRAWKEPTRPPAFPKAGENETGRAVESVFWLSPGHASQKGVWYAGTTPAGLFRSEDNGDTWEPISGFNDHPLYSEWTKMGGTPGGLILHSVLIDPRDPDHMYASISVGGTFESVNGGKYWDPLNKGIAADFMPDPNVPFGHDPHCMVMHPLMPDRLYQQNHCGIYRIDRPSDTWTRIGKAMPKKVGDIGFPIVMHPRDPNCVWVFPMDGTEVWPRTSPGGKPAVYVSRNAGKTWSRQDEGLPEANAYFTVKRQAMCADSFKRVGLYFGNSSGEVWGSRDEGDTWKSLVRYLPEIFSLTVAEES